MEYQLLPEWVLLSVTMLIKSIVQSGFQVWVRIRYQLYAVGEDKKLFYRFRQKGRVDSHTGEARLERYSKLWQNDLECIPLFLIVALGFTLLGGDEYWGTAYFVVFAMARISYTICYINAIQPGRGISWDTGLISTLFLAVHSFYLDFPLVFL